MSLILWHILAVVMIFWLGWIIGRRAQNRWHWEEMNNLRHYYEGKKKKNGTQDYNKRSFT